MRLYVNYRIVLKKRARTFTCKGTTKDISHTGLLLDTLEQHAYGTTVELLIDWPCGHGDRQGLRLCVMGWIVRSNEKGTAVKILRYGFTRQEDDLLFQTWAGADSREIDLPKSDEQRGIRLRKPLSRVPYE